MKDYDNRKKNRKDSVQKKYSKKIHNDEESYYMNKANKQFKQKKKHLIEEDYLDDLEDYNDPS